MSETLRYIRALNRHRPPSPPFPPLQDAEAFLHRSGRTGRAGKTGSAIILFRDSESRSVGQILKQTKVRYVDRS